MVTAVEGVEDDEGEMNSSTLELDEEDEPPGLFAGFNKQKIHYAPSLSRKIGLHPPAFFRESPSFKSPPRDRSSRIKWQASRSFVSRACESFRVLLMG